MKQIRIPQQEWAEGIPPLGANGLPVADGVVRWFDIRAGFGEITHNDSEENIFFHFTGIPGVGYRTLKSGTKVQFEVQQTNSGPIARNIQTVKG